MSQQKSCICVIFGDYLIKHHLKKKNISNNHDINTWELKSTLENCAYHATSMSFVCLLHKVEMKMILLKVLQRLNMYYSRVLS